MKIKVELSGGLQIIFKGTSLEVELEDKDNLTIKDLVKSLKSRIYERPEFFLTPNDEM